MFRLIWIGLLLLSVCVFYSSSVFSSTTLVQSQLANDAADGLIVKFKANTSKSSQLHALTASGLRSVERFALVPGLTFVKPVAGESVLSTMSSIQSDPNVEYVEPNYLVSILRVPDDPKFNTQYGMQNTGQTGGILGADISAPGAWDVSTGTDVVVAIIDTGVEYTHSELRNNIWVNPGEIPGNNIDDDNNGFVDDIHGWDFSNADADPMDDMGHGTHVAGVIAARGNNGIGIAGINWRARIMALKFIDVNGIGTTTKAIKAINYAVAMGARVSNNSWGGGAFSQALSEVIAAAERAGHIFVAASGNLGLNTDDPANAIHYPSSYAFDNVISVTATNEADTLTSFSNVGGVSVDLAAPGRQVNSLWINNSYMPLDGTSMAAPFVTGAVALLWSVNPLLNYLQVRSAILNNVDSLPVLQGITTTGGRLNLEKAIKSVSVDISVTPFTKYISINDSIRFTASGGTPPYTWAVNNTSVANIDASSGVLSGITAGSIRVQATDAMGFKGSSSDIVIENLAIQPELAFINVGEQLQFTVSGGIAPYTWSSTNSSVASIDSATGRLTGNSAGQTSVIARDSNNISVQSGTIEVAFIPDLTLTPQQNQVLYVGDTLQFLAAGGLSPFSWQSSNNSIINVDSSGLITAVGTGTAQITVFDSSGVSRTSGDIVVQNLSVTIAKSSMRINETQILSINGGVAPYEWFVSNSLVAQVDSQGVLTGLSPGSVKVSVRDVNGIQTSSDMILITDANALSLSTDASILIPGEIAGVTVTGGIVPLTWTSSNPSVLAVNQNAGSITAMGAGVAYISVQDAVSDVVSSAIIEVRDITITAQRSSYMVNETDQFVASGGSAPYSWQVDNFSVANISSSGIFQARNTGSVTVGVVDADGIRGESKIINITAGVAGLVGFEVTPNTAMLSRRSTTTITFLVSGGLAPYQFSLSNPVGTINEFTGEYTPKSSVAGKTTIIVTDADGHKVESGLIEVR